MRSHRAVILTTAILAFILGCGGGDKKNPVNPGGGGADVTINIVANNAANSYSPNPVTVTVGQTVAWHNSNGTAHTATADNGTTFGTGVIAPGATSAKVAMNAAGSYSYACTIHPGMTGTLVVQVP